MATSNGDGDRSMFTSALYALQSHSTSADERKRANEWLLAFQRNSACWGVATQLLLDASTPADVQLFAAQTLKARARLMRHAPVDQVQQLQRDILHVLSQLSHGGPQLARQLCLALVDTSLPSPDMLGQLISHLTANLPSSTALLALEYLADGVSSLTHFGSGGSNEERVEALADLKAKLRSHAAALFAWLSSLAQQTTAPQQNAAAILNCFNAWTRLGGLHSVTDHSNLEALVSLALSHMRQPSSEAFEASADALAEVVDCCPEAWLDALQEPLVALVDVAVGSASAGETAAAEHICRVIGGYASLRIIHYLPATEPSRALLNSLVRLAALPQTGDSGDPACWPALKAWVDIVEAIMGQAQENGEHEDDGSTPDPQFQTASDLAAATQWAKVPKEVQTVLDQVLVSVLGNMVAWQRAESGGDEAIMDGFTPSFIGTIMDFFAASCDVVGPNRFTSLLCMMVEQQQQQQQNGSEARLAAYVVAAAMHAVAAAGGRRLASDPASLQMLAMLLHKAASLASHKELRSKTLMVPFCCAASSAGRAVIGYLRSSNQPQEADRFVSSTLEIALDGLSMRGGDHDSLDVQTPAATAVRSIMQGSKDAGMPVPEQCIQTLVLAVQQHTQLPPLAESNLMLALSSAVLSLREGEGTRTRIQRNSMQQLIQPLQALLSQVLQQRDQQQAMPAGADEQLRAHLRRVELLLQSALAPEGDNEEFCDHDQAPESGAGASVDQGALSWLSDVFACELWPQLRKVLTKNDLSGSFLAPLCKTLALLMRALPARYQDSLPSVVQGMVDCMFRPGGLVAHQPLSVCLELYSGTSAQCQELLQQAVQHILTKPRVVSLAQLGAADQDPELAECCAKVSSSYVRHLLPAVATHNREAASSAAAAIVRTCAACTCSHHRGVSLAALACSGDLVSSAVIAQRAAHASQQSEQQQQADVLTHAVLENGSMVCMGIIGGLLSTHPLSRLHKSSTILAELALLASSRAPGQADQQQLVTSWLSAATAGCQLSAGEQQSILQAWPTAILESAAGLNRSSREQNLACRGLKKLLREFAETHAREN